MLEDLRALTKDMELAQKGMELSPEAKEAIEALAIADKHLSKAQENYGKFIGSINKLVSAQDNMKPVASAQVRCCVTKLLNILADATEQSVQVHENAMIMSKNHNIALACCNGK